MMEALSTCVTWEGCVLSCFRYGSWLSCRGTRYYAGNHMEVLSKTTEDIRLSEAQMGFEYKQTHYRCAKLLCMKLYRPM